MCNNLLKIKSREDSYFDKSELKREKERDDYVDSLIYEQKEREANEDNE